VKAVPVHVMKAYVAWMKTPFILYLGVEIRCVVGFVLSPIYHRVNSPKKPLNRRLGGSQTRSGSCGGNSSFLSLTGIELCLLDRPARSLFTFCRLVSY
jgi:hypothetical protein